MDSLILVIIISVVWVVLWYIGKKLHFSDKGIVIYPFLFMVKTQRANKFFESLGKKIPRRFDVVLHGIGAVLGIIGMILLTWNAILLILSPASSSAVAPIIPGVTIPFSATLVMILLSLMIALVVHESAHGAMMSRDGIPIVSSGVFVFAIFPGGFVEPDETEFNNASRRTKRTVLAVGSASNLGVGLIAMALLFGLVAATPYLYGSPSGVYISSTVDGSPVDGRIPTPSILVAINSTPVHTLEDLDRYIDVLSPGDTVCLTVVRIDTNEALNVTITLAESPYNHSRGFIGISGIYTYYERRSFVAPDYVIFLYLLRFVSWLYILNINIAIVNMMPIPGFDGMKFIETFIKHRKLAIGIEIVATVIFLINLIGSGIIHGWKIIG